MGELRHGFPACLPDPSANRSPGSARLVLEPGLLVGHVVKRYAQRRVVSVVRRVVRGTTEAITAVLAATRGGTGIATAAIERLNATFRNATDWEVRRPGCS